MNDFERMLLEAGIDPAILDNPVHCIDLIRERLPATVAMKVADSAENEGLIATALNISPDSLRDTSQRLLNQYETESLIDVLRTVRDAMAIWPTAADASQWFNSSVPAMVDKRPMDWCDTFEGRRWVRSVLRKIADGDFS